MTVTMHREIRDYIHHQIQQEVGTIEAITDPAGAVVQAIGPEEVSRIKEMFITAGEQVDEAFLAYLNTSQSDPSWRKHALAALIAARYSLLGADQYTLSYLQLVDSLLSSNQLDSVIENL